MPGDAVPNLGAAAWILQSRWTTQPKSQNAYIATAAAAKLFGGKATGRLKHQYIVPLRWAYDVWGFYASAAAVTIVVSLVGLPSKFWHWPLYLLGLPALVLYILYLRSLFALLLLAALLTAVVAGVFDERKLADSYRSLWLSHPHR